jgi:hypothetical protein
VRDSLAIQLGDRVLAGDLYADVRTQMLRAPEPHGSAWPMCSCALPCHWNIFGISVTLCVHVDTRTNPGNLLWGHALPT